MPDFSHDRLCGSESLQETHAGISAKIQLPSNILVGDATINGQQNDDYANFFLIYNHYVEAGISYTPHKGGFRIFLNTGAFYGGDENYWRSQPISELGLNFGFGSTVKLTLIPNGSKSTLYVNDQAIYTLDNYQPQPSGARVGYTHGCQDQFGYVQHNTATWSEVKFLRSGSWVNWDVYSWGYAPYRQNPGAYGIYTEHPVSAYLAKPNGPDPAGDGQGV